MNKLKIIIVAISIVVLVIISFVLLRFIQGLLFTAAQDLQQAGEATIVETEPEERWVAPTMPVVYDIENGINSVEAEDKTVSTEPTDLCDDDDVVSVPIEETADQLADTAPEDDILGSQDMDALPD